MEGTVLDFRDFAGNVFYYLAAPFLTCWDRRYFCYYFWAAGLSLQLA